MNSKERVLKSINLIQPDRVPVIVNLSQPLAMQFAAKYSGKFSDKPFCALNTLISGRASYNDLLIELGNDCIGIAAECNPQNVIWGPNGSYVDEWGMEFCSINGYLEVTKRPLAVISEVSEVNSYSIPDPTLPERWTSAKREISKYGDTHAVMGCMGQTMFEMCWNLMGFEKLLMDLCIGEDYILTLLDRLIEYSIEYADMLIKLDCDIIFIGDDVGSQSGMLISPELWRYTQKPRLKKLCQHIKSNKNIKIAYHSCGSILPIIPDLIEIGIDILNPVQPLAKDMNLSMLKKEYGSKLCFYGGIDVQNCVPSGSKEEIDEEVKNAINAAACGGGYIIAPAHIVPSETKLENVCYFFEAVKKYGKYI